MFVFKIINLEAHFLYVINAELLNSFPSTAKLHYAEVNETLTLATPHSLAFLNRE